MRRAASSRRWSTRQTHCMSVTTSIGPFAKSRAALAESVVGRRSMVVATGGLARASDMGGQDSDGGRLVNRRHRSYLCEVFHKQRLPVKRIADSTVRRLSMYLRYLEDLDANGQPTASSDELAHLCGTTPAQVRKDLSFFGSFEIGRAHV